MATRNSKTAQKTTRNTGRVGRPSNIERAAKLRSQADQFVTLAAASYAQGMRDALAIDGGIQTIGSLNPAIAQSAQSSSAGSATASASQSTSRASRSSTRTKSAPGRKEDPTSKLSQTKEFYAQNLKASKPLTRAEFVKAAAEKFDYRKEIANTYVSNIEREGGYKLERRGGNTASRSGTKRSTRTSQTAKAA